MKSLIRSLTKEQLENIVKDSQSINEALRKIGYVYTNGTNHQLFRTVCQELNIDYSHFTGLSKTIIKRTEKNIFIENSTAAQSTLRNQYKKGNYTPYKCAICGIKEQQNKELNLRLDHINGNNRDDRLENLRQICPNCDSQLETFCRGQKNKIKIMPQYCEDCGKEISYGAKKCIICQSKDRRVVERPAREELKNLIRTIPFTKIAEKYGVSDKAITKQCIAENLPSRKKDINLISDEDQINI